MITKSRTKVAIIAEWRSGAMENSRDIRSVQLQCVPRQPRYADTYNGTFEGVKLLPYVVIYTM